jgi:gluconolactonase
MPRIALDLNQAEDQQKVKGQWRVAPGLVPGEPNEGLTARLLATPARLADYDDSGWEVCTNIRKSLSEGFTFAWYRMTVELPQRLGDFAVAGSRVFFETNSDNYGETWVNGEIDRTSGVIVGLNAQQRVEISNSAVPGEKFVIACLVLNGPLAQPRGGIFMRYATLAFEASDA